MTKHPPRCLLRRLPHIPRSARSLGLLAGVGALATACQVSPLYRENANPDQTVTYTGYTLQAEVDRPAIRSTWRYEDGTWHQYLCPDDACDLPAANAGFSRLELQYFDGRSWRRIAGKDQWGQLFRDGGGAAWLAYEFSQGLPPVTDTRYWRWQPGSMALELQARTLSDGRNVATFDENLDKCRQGLDSGVAIMQKCRKDDKTVFSTRQPIQGATSCGPGEDCNRCLPNVEEAFRSLAERHDYDDWTIDAPIRRYQPDDEMFEQLRHSSHIQGFARLNGGGPGGYWYAGTRSKPDDGPAGMFIISHDDKKMKYYYALDNGHPGGLQPIGDKVAIASDWESGGSWRTTVSFWDVSDVGNAREVDEFELHRTAAPSGVSNTRASGVGVVRLVNGRYLMALAHRSRDLKFMISDRTSLDGNAGWHWLNQVGAGSGWREMENVNLVTECGTANLYAIGFSGHDYSDDWFEPSPDNWADLYRLSDDGRGGIAVRRVDGWKPDWERTNCIMRGGASAYTGGGTLDLYCSSKVHHRWPVRDSRAELGIRRVNAIISTGGTTATSCPAGQHCSWESQQYGRCDCVRYDP
jgi:hypothetical protein